MVAMSVKDRLLETGRAVLLSLAQVAFTNTPLQGLLILLAIALLSPWSALGALIGALLSAMIGPRLGQSLEDLNSGLGGYNSAILGILWGGALAQGGAPALLFPLALLACLAVQTRSEEHTSELQSRFGISYAVFCLKKKNNNQVHTHESYTHDSHDT